MKVVSEVIGWEQVHFEAPEAKKVASEMTRFLTWFNASTPLDAVPKAGVAHLWFVTIHPFEDGNGRVARALTELQLARADASAQRFYSLSAQMRLERPAYYAQLKAAQKGGSRYYGVARVVFGLLEPGPAGHGADPGQGPSESKVLGTARSLPF